MSGPREQAKDGDQIQSEALDWIVHLTSGEATTQDGEALQRWRGQSDHHKQAMAEAARLHAGLRLAAVELANEQRRALSQRQSSATPFFGRRRLIAGAVAASAAAYYMAWHPPLGLWPSLAELDADYRTGTGERHSIELAQGVSVELNTQTSISIPKHQAGARIDLLSGEALITARRDAAAPVIVAAAGGEVRSSDAQFDVRFIHAAVRVTCVTGQVLVAHAGREVHLQAGQQCRYGDGLIQMTSDADSSQILAWRSDLLIFHDQPLNAVIAELNRYRRGRVVLTNSKLGRVRINGVFHLDRLDDVVEQIKDLGVSVTTLPGGVILLN